jgi:hypothetical protein
MVLSTVCNNQARKKIAQQNPSDVDDDDDDDDSSNDKQQQQLPQACWKMMMPILICTKARMSATSTDEGR